MHRYKRTLYIALFGVISILITLISLLFPFLNEKTSLQKDARFLSAQIVEQVTTDNAKEITDSFLDQENYEITIFSFDSNLFCSTLSNISSKEYHQIKKHLNESFRYSNKEVRHEAGYGYVTHDVAEDIYVFVVSSDTDVLVWLKWFTIFGPISVFLLSLSYGIFDFIKYKQSAIYLRNQVRKLRTIAKIDSMVEYDNDIENLANIVRDTRKHMEASIKKNYISEQKINFILDSIEQGILVVDSKFRILLANNKGRAVMNLSSSDKVLEEDEFTKSVLINTRVLLSTKRPMVFIKEKEGKYIEFNINVAEVDFDNQNETMISLLMVDITDKYNSEKMKRDFFANAAHELKSPLTSILGYQELISDGILTSKEELENANLRTIKEGERMKKLIMEMLKLSSLENNNLRAIEKIDVCEELDNILAMLENQIMANQIKLIRHYQKVIIKMNIDDFYNLFKNLIENAIRYNKTGGSIEITIDTTKHDISIKDTGLGIKDEDKARIFERFYRVDKARSRENGGTGLGLSIVKYICNYYGYKISIDSTLGSGSTFTIHYQD